MRWQGWDDPKDDTWEPRGHLETVPTMVDACERRLEALPPLDKWAQSGCRYGTFCRCEAKQEIVGWGGEWGGSGGGVAGVNWGLNHWGSDQ